MTNHIIVVAGNIGTEPYYQNGFYGYLYVGADGATGGNHYQGNFSVYSVGNMICMIVPPGYEAMTTSCVTKTCGGSVNFGLRAIDTSSGTDGDSGASGAAVVGFLIGARGGKFSCEAATVSVPEALSWAIPSSCARLIPKPRVANRPSVTV